MAHIKEQMVVIKLSKLLKNVNCETIELIDSRQLALLEEIVQDFVGSSLVVELEDLSHLSI